MQKKKSKIIFQKKNAKKSGKAKKKRCKKGGVYQKLFLKK